MAWRLAKMRELLSSRPAPMLMPRLPAHKARTISVKARQAKTLRKAGPGRAAWGWTRCT